MEVYVNKNIKALNRIKSSEDRRNYLRLDMNENPEGLPKEFVEKVLKKITPEFIATYPQKENLIKLIADKNDISINNISITNGSDEAMRLIFETFGENGKNVVTVNPSFEMYNIYSQMFGMNNIRVSYDESFNIQIPDILSSIDKDTRLVILLNPNSPIGNTYLIEDVIRIIKKAKENNAIVVIDEAYYYFYGTTFLKLVNEYKNVLLLRTFSKLFSIAGLRIGYVIGNNELIQYIENAESTYNVNNIAILFAEEILKDNKLTNDLIRIEKEGHDYIVNNLEANGYKIYSTNGNYLIFKSNLSASELERKLKARGILIKTYKSGILSEYVRITTGSINVMKKFLQELLLVDTKERIDE